MTALKPAQIDAFLARPNPAQPVVLVFGPDAGLVRERAETLIRASVEDMSDPFSLVRLDGDDLAGEPSRLVEEANTIPLFGGRRAVWVKAGARNFAPALETLLASTSPDCRVVIEAGELRKNAPLRAICERAKNAAALPCYEDNDDALARLIDTEMREAGLSIAPEARTALIPLLGGDRLASRGEVRKLALYARGAKRVELDDVMAVVTDASTLALDDLVDASFAGKVAEVETVFVKARNAGTSPGTILFAASRHVSSLHKARLTVDAGQSASAAVAGMWLHFSRVQAAEVAVKAWSAPRLEQALRDLGEASLEARKRADMAESITHRALMSIALRARQKR